MKKFTERAERFLSWGGVKKDIVLLVLSGAALLYSLFEPFTLPFDAAWIAVVLCGIPILAKAAIGLITAFDIKADLLVSLALVASICIGEYFAAGEVAFIMQLGSFLEDLTVSRARAGIERLVRLTPQTARRLTGKDEEVVPAEKVEVGDILRVLPGESVPVDGVILSGQTSVNQAVMTGESLPVDKSAGDEVLSGTVNQFGAFEMRASKVGADSSIQRMIRLVQSADAGKARIVGMADRWATWIVVIALTAAALTWLISGEILRAVTVLVVFCPCSLVLATPTAIMAAIGNATRHGFLVKEGDALERLSQVDKIAFDKTGTLTRGRPEVTAVRSLSPDFTEEEIFLFAAAAEQLSEHPLGKAVTFCCRQRSKEALPEARNFRMRPGRGVSAEVKGRMVLAGSAEMMREEGILFAGADGVETRGGSTVVYVAIDGRTAGYLVMSDTVRVESAAMIEALFSLGVQPVLLTGDNRRAAEKIAERLQIREVHVECLPEDKLRYIESCQEKNQAVCMIGDGINDAPALKKALVGIAMGGAGSDIAVDAADIALVDDEIRELPHLISLSRRMMTTIRCNIGFSMGLNLLAIVLAISGLLNPVVGALVHNAGSVLVILSSAMLLRWKKRERPKPVSV